jgi:hypothetical protein
MQENRGAGSQSVTATQFLRERGLHFSGVSQGILECEAGERQEEGSIAVSSQPPLDESGRASFPLGAGCVASPERWLEFESGSGGDHDIPYSFALPAFMPQALAWVRLLARVQRGEVQL